MKNKKDNKNFIILILIIALFGLAVGYAAFSDLLTISGTANAKGTFDLEFQNAEIVKNIGADETKTTAIISADKDTLTVNVADLSYPGAGVEFAVDIVNVGSMPAEIQAVTPNNITGSNKIKVIGLDAIKTDHSKLEVGDRCNMHFTVEWPVDSGEIPESESSISFGLQIEYIQTTGENNEDIVPDYTVPTGLTATYGQKLSDIELPEGFKFQDSLETLVGNVGTNSFKVTYTLQDNKEVNDIEVLIEVEKANPTYTVPTGLTATYGQKLSDVELPKGFEFQDSLEILVGNGGMNQFKVTYTPVDTNNYNAVSDIEVLINVQYSTLVSQITAADYGKSINYKATVTNYEIINATCEISNWKLLYKDDSNVYIILDDFLPNYLVPFAEEPEDLSILGTHEVYAYSDRQAFLNALRTTTYWSEFANGYEGATAQGAPNFDILIKSYNEKHNASIDTDSTKGNRRIILDTTDTLYVPHTTKFNGVSVYWLADEYPGYQAVWSVAYDGSVFSYAYSKSGAGVRPVVMLPSSIRGTVGKTIEIK